MGLETGDYIEDLVQSNPVGATDPKGQGDDHLRLIKKCIQQSFPGGDGAWNFPTANVTFQNVTAFGGNFSLLAATDAGGAPAWGIAGSSFTGAGGFAGGRYGLTAVQRTAAGTYEIQISDTALRPSVIEDVQMAWTVDYGVLGIGIAALYEPTVNSLAQGWVKIVTAPPELPDTPADPLGWGVVLFNNALS